MGCTVETVNNGAEAVTAVQKKKYDLVLMDIRCPSWTANAATRAIRGRKNGVRGIPKLLQ